MKRQLGTIWAGLLLAGSALCAAPGRQVENFNADWRFERFGSLADGSTRPEPAGLEKAQADDQAWRKLDVPHDWGVEGPFRQELNGATGKLPWKGIGWYRKHFTLTKADEGRRIFIELDGAMAHAQVWLNGQKVGEWPYGYTSFQLELTPFVRLGQENVLAVRLDTDNWNSRWYPGAGIYRNVRLVKTDPVHVAHWGVQLTTPDLTDKQGPVQLAVQVQNQRPSGVEAQVQTAIYELSKDDVAGAQVALSAPVKLNLKAETNAVATLNATVAAPKRWDLATPVRYLARTTVQVNGQVVDTVDTPFGFRTLKFTAHDGFYLNGRRVQVFGVCQHHDLGALGAAVNLRALERQIEILQEMGCNAIRTSHNPPTPELLDLCDKMGVLVMVEAFDTWHKSKKPKDYADLFAAWHEKDIRAMVRRDRNHPSVFMWSTGNEIPARETPEGMANSARLTALVKEEDTTRPVTCGSNSATKHMKNGFQTTMDIYGFNYAPSGYADFHKVPGNENRLYIASETASTVSSRGEYFFPVATKFESAQRTTVKGNFQISSYDVQAPGWGCTPDIQFGALDSNPACLGEFVWTGFDYLGEPTPYNKDESNLLNFTGDPNKLAALKKQLDELGKIETPSRSSYFGIIDLAGFKKDRFYIYQARWRPELPMAHLLPHWNWPERIGQVTPVHLYTSGDEAELFLNGKSLGKKKRGPNDYRLRWDDVVYEPGTLKAVVYKNGKPWAEDTMKTTGPASRLALSVDRSTLRADGQDLAFVTVDVCDDAGLMVPRSSNLVRFALEGPGRIIAVDNGDAASFEPFQADYRKAFNGKCLVIVRTQAGQAGKFVLKAESEGLKPATVEFQSK